MGVMLIVVVLSVVAVIWATRDALTAEERREALRDRAADLVWALEQGEDPNQRFRVHVALERVKAAIEVNL